MKFKDFLILQESKAIIFPKEVQDQLDVITKKMINTLSELDKENKDPEKEKYRRVGSIVFNDPYTKEQENEKAYNVFAVKPTEKNKTISGFHSVYEGEPIISVTTNVGRNYDSVYNILTHELTHAYDPTIARGYRNPMGSALQDGKKTKLTPYFNPYKDYSNQEGKQDAYDKYFEQEPEFLANVSAYANYMINSALRDTKNDSPDLLFMKKNIIYKQLIDYIKKGFPDYYYDNLSNDLIKNKIHAVSYFHRFKNKNPKFSRKLLQKLSNAANEAYNIVDRHIKTNNLESKVSPEVKKFINDNANAELIPQHEPIEDLLDELINGRKNKTKSSGWEYL